MSSLSHVQPGDHLRVRDEIFRVGSRRERVRRPDGLLSFTFPAQNHGGLTGYTVSTLYVDRDPYELDVCNGPTHEIDPAAVEPAEVTG